MNSEVKKNDNVNFQFIKFMTNQHSELNIKK